MCEVIDSRPAGLILWHVLDRFEWPLSEFREESFTTIDLPSDLVSKCIKKVTLHSYVDLFVS
jgi:hypothetical protein